jgi:RNA polymerase sigma factor (sigma-70 family)
VLAVITARKAAHLVRDASRQKRGGGRIVRGEDDDGSAEMPLLEQVLSREPTPEMAAEVAEEFQRLFQALDDAELEQVAQLRLEGWSVEEIAHKLGYAPRSIKRKLHLIRSLWEREIDS